MLWVSVGKPRHGPECHYMQRTRARFKCALRYCQRHELQINADKMAERLMDKDYKGFWDTLRKSSNDKATCHSTTIGGCSGVANIVNMWKDHFEKLYNSVNVSEARDKFMTQMSNAVNQEYTIHVSDVIDAVSKQKKGKAAGIDGVHMEAFIYGCNRLFVHISILFNLFLKYCYIPKNFMLSVIVPLVKCKTKDLSDVDNYRAICLSSTISKLFESVIAKEVTTVSVGDEVQFGFKAGLSTGLCTKVLKTTVDYYSERGSHVFCCFLDFSKAFDRVNYWHLFSKLLNDGVNCNIIRMLAFWYSHQEMCVRWSNKLSDSFTVSNGTRQGSILSPHLFARYIRDLLLTVLSERIGCNIGGQFINVLAYADDLVLLAPSWSAMQHLLNVLYAQINMIDMNCNVQKTVCMVFKPKKRDRVIASSFPMFRIGDNSIQFVSEFKYLGHLLNNRMTDDDDIQREVKNMFIRTNVLMRRFGHCSVLVKLNLFRSYCMCFYDIALWRTYLKGSIQKLRSCYNKCLKMFFHYNRRYSLTQALLELRLPTFDTILANNTVRFSERWKGCENKLVKFLATLPL